MIEIQKICKSYGKKAVLKDFSIKVPGGKIVGILGQNGCGKSTLLSILFGLVPCNSGSFLFDSKDLLKDTTLRNKTVAYVPQELALIDELTAFDNLNFWYKKDELEKSLKYGFLHMLGINDFLKVPVNKMSGGMKKRLSLGCAIHNFPKILLLDEPTASLDLECKQKIYDYLKEFTKAGGTVFVVTHEVQEIELTDICYIIKDGLAQEYKYDGNIQKLSKEIWG